MSLVEMTLGGACIILAAALLRALAKDRLPVGAFEALWALAWARLVLPVRLPFRFSAFTLARRLLPHAAAPAPVPAAIAPTGEITPQIVDIIQNLPQANQTTPFPTVTALWLAGAAVCAALLAVRYIRACRRFRDAAPLESSYVNQFKAAHPLRRTLSVRVSDRVAAPLTYGLIRPVILLPRSMDGADGDALGYVLAHELAHIRRLDAARKPLLAAAACLHWFDPAAWLMLYLAGRDMERACDRAVVRSLDDAGRRAYARALLDMEERRAGFSPCSGFAKNAIEERIHSIMKIRPRTFLSTLLALALILSVGAVFATAAEDDPAPVVDTAPTAFSGEVMTASDGTVYVFTADGEPVSMTQQEYKMLFPTAEVEWWTAEEYAAWLEQEKKDLQDCLGQRAWTRSDGWFTWTQEKIDETIEMYEQVLADIQSGLLVSKTVDGGNDVALMQGSGDTFFFSVDPATDTDSGWSAADLDRGYYYTLADGVDSVTLGPYDTPEELLEALEAEVDAWVADGRLTEEEAQGILDHFDPAPGAVQVYTPGGEVAYSFNGGKSVTLTEEEQAALDTLMKNPQLADALGVAADQQLYTIMVTPTYELEEQLAALDRTIEPYLPFGLRYTYDSPTGELTLTWNGQQVRELYDSTAGVWITAHAGDGAWPEGTPELVAVYEGGKLAGLRLATEEEQAQWDRLRADAGIYSSPTFLLLSAEETEDAPPVQESDGTVTVPAKEEVIEFFQQADGAPYGSVERGGRVMLANGVAAAAGNTVSIGIQARTDASLTVSLHGDSTAMGQSVDLKAGEMQTVTFRPEQDETFNIYLTNNSEYAVEFIASWAVS